MRSRYTAYVVGSVEHLLRTWHPRTRPASLTLPAGTTWVDLDVRAVVAGGSADDAGEVDFVAHWRADGQSGVLRERSTFARRGDRWMYVDGVTP